MTSLKTKWELRQLGLSFLSCFLCSTSVLLALIVIRAYQYSQCGLDLYPDLEFPKRISVDLLLSTFWDQSVWPLLPWVPVCFAFDTILRRYIYGLNQ